MTPPAVAEGRYPGIGDIRSIRADQPIRADQR